MAYGLKYIVEFKDYANRDAAFNLYEDGYSGDVTYLLGGDVPVLITYNTDADGNPYSPIFSSNLTLKFVNRGAGDPYSKDFLTTTDKKYKGELVVDDGSFATTQIAWVGYLSNELSGEIQTNAAHYISLNFYDGLGKLKDEPLVDIDGVKYTSPNQRVRLFDLIRTCLKRAVGEELPIIIYDNLFEISQANRLTLNTNCPIYKTKVDLRTFTKDIVDYTNCYDVLTAILDAKNLQLIQSMGNWVVSRKSELFFKHRGDGTKYTLGTASFVGYIQTDNLWRENEISKVSSIVPVQNFMLKSYRQPYKTNKVIFNYEEFEEIICNEKFKRGAAAGTASAGPYTYKYYDIDCWSVASGTYNSPTIPASIGGTNIFRREEEFDSDLNLHDEFITVGGDVISNGSRFIISERQLINGGDKLNINLTMRISSSSTGPSTRNVIIVLYRGLSGTNYTLDNNGNWATSNASFTTNVKQIQYYYGSTDSMFKWVDVKVNSDYIPESGELQIILNDWYPASASGGSPYLTQYKDFDINVQSYAAGRNLSNLTGDYDSNDHTAATNKLVNEKTVLLSDIGKYCIKGALFKENGTELTTLWENLSYPDGAGYRREHLKQWCAIDMHILNRRFNSVIEGTFKGLFYLEENGTSRKSLINPLCRFTFTGEPNKVFMPMLINSIDIKRGIWSGTVLEVQDTTESYNNLDISRKFDYILK